MLGEVWSSALPLAERRRLASRVAIAALGACGGGCNDDVDARGSDAEVPTVDRMEEALCEVAALAGDGMEKLGVSAAKAVLRGRGVEGARVASRLSRLSKARNTVAHPDVGLPAAIRALAHSRVGQEPEPEARRSDDESVVEELARQAQEATAHAELLPARAAEARAAACENPDHEVTGVPTNPDTGPAAVAAARKLQQASLAMEGLRRFFGAAVAEADYYVDAEGVVQARRS